LLSFVFFGCGALWRAATPNRRRQQTRKANQLPPPTHPSNKAKGALFDWMNCWLAALPLSSLGRREIDSIPLAFIHSTFPFHFKD